MRDRVALLDRDGTVIVERNYLSDPNAVELLPNAATGMRMLQERGFRLVLVTNQSGIGRGYFSAETVDQIHAKLKQKLQAEGISLDAIYLCPHTPEDHCDCRKPEPGLALQAAADLGFELKHAIVIGDKPCDIELAERIGAMSVLVKTGYGEEYLKSGSLQPDLVADDLKHAAELILLLTAIEEARLVRLVYKGKLRVIEPHDYGIHKGLTKLLAYQISGASTHKLPNWRWMEQDLISDVELLDRKFPGGRPETSDKHNQWDKLFIRVKPAETNP